MSARTKIIIAVLVIAAAGFGYYLTAGDSSLFQGLIMKDGPVDQELLKREKDEGLMVDLEAGLEVIEGDELVVSATIANVGDGSVLANVPFTYVIYVNDDGVYSNTDSYTSIDPGDEFSFELPISQEIYEYPDEGVVRFVIDVDGELDEKDVSNNIVEVGYSL